MFMSKSYSVAAARAKLAEIVDQVESGKEVELTRRGKKVAVVLSAAKYARLSGSRVAFMAAFDNFCREHEMREIGVGRGWAEELRDPSPGRSVKL
jgi:prevent-host-death family protein